MENSENKDYVPSEGEITDGNLDQVSGGVSTDPKDNLENRLIEAPFEALQGGFDITAIRERGSGPERLSGTIKYIHKAQRGIGLQCSNGLFFLYANEYRFYCEFPG